MIFASQFSFSNHDVKLVGVCTKQAGFIPSEEITKCVGQGISAEQYRTFIIYNGVIHLHIYVHFTLMKKLQLPRFRYCTQHVLRFQ